jgi:hypothetical protein
MTDADDVTAGGGDRRGGRVRTEARYALEIVALCAFVFAQPVLDVFGRFPETFIQHGASRMEIIGFALFWALVPALAIIAVAAVVGIAGPTARWWAQVVVVALASGTMASIVVRDLTEWAMSTTLAVASVAAIGAGVAYRSLPVASRYLRYASPAAAVFAALFLFFSPVSSLVVPTSAAVVGSGLGRDAPDVVFVVFDEFPTVTLLDPEGAIDRELYPNFARFADDATWYRNATTVATTTSPAVPALLSGHLPRIGGLAPVAGEHPETLFTWLGDSHRFHVDEFFTRLCPAGLCPEDTGDGSLRGLLARGAEVWADRAQPDPPTPEVPEPEEFFGVDYAETFSRFTTELDTSPYPQLDYIHVMLPHHPWRLLPDGRRYDWPGQIGRDPDGFLPWTSPHAAAVNRQRHVLQTMATDRLVGGLLDRLEALDRYDDALVVVTADHGVAFVDGEPTRGASPGNYEQIMWVPLLIKAPGQTDGAIDDRNVELVDVMPTIADHLGTELPWETDGESLLGGLTRPDDTKRARAARTTFDADDDGLIRVDAVEGFRRVLAQAPVVPPGDELRVWRQGRHGDLVGTRPGDHRIGPPSTVEARLEEPTRYDDVDPDDEPPIDLRGAVLVDEPISIDIAVSVNGTIGGWSETFTNPRTDEPNSIYTLFPFEFLRPRRQDIVFYEIVRSGDAVVLRPIELTNRP